MKTLGRLFIPFIGFFFFSFFLFNSEFSQAAKVRILKVKNNEAVVTVQGGNVRVGEVYSLGDGDRSPSGGDSSYGSKGGGSRRSLFGLSGFFRSTTSTVNGTSFSSTNIKIEGKYGINQGTSEFGGYGGYETSSTGSSSSALTTLSLGGFFDHNLTSNLSGVGQIFGFGGQGGILNTNVGNSSQSGMAFFGGAFGKWFIFRDTCLRADIGLIYETLSSVTTTGLGLKGGLLTYF